VLSRNADPQLVPSKYESLSHAALSGPMSTGLWADFRHFAPKSFTELIKATNTNLSATVGAWGAILHVACYLGMLELIGMCLDTGVEINLQGGHFGCALAAAIHDRHFEAVIFPRTFHLNINIFHGDRTSPIDPDCATKGHEVVKMLLEHGASMDASVP
jgi:hypothetical protein